ncbi:MAG: class I SAM-dependent methyltransferase [Pseudomonadota bacterium]
MVSFARKLKGLFRPEKGKFSSGRYWEQRYQSGRNSGAGSYGRLAAYKSDVINELLESLDIRSVIEFGSGDGNQAALLNPASYVGVDVAHTAVEECRKTFRDRPNFKFYHTSERETYFRPYDMSMSLDVIYHLTEDDVFHQYMRDLFACAGKYCLIYASDHDEMTGNVHVRHRSFSDWISEHEKDWECIKVFEHPYPKSESTRDDDTSFAHFKLFGNKNQ